MKTPGRLFAAVALSALGIGGAAYAQQSGMSFFVTSAAIGKGADLGGLDGADRYCQQLAQSAGAGSRTWHAYLSTQAADGKPAVNARDRIGKGPWQNAKGVVVAKDVDELHGQNNLTKQTSLTEKGDIVNGRGDTPNKHDALGQAARRVPRSSAISTARAWMIRRRRIPGIRRTPRAAPRAAAARPICTRPAATACSTASPQTRALKRRPPLVLLRGARRRSNLRV